MIIWRYINRCFIALALAMDRKEERREMLSATPGPISMLISPGTLWMGNPGMRARCNIYLGECSSVILFHSSIHGADAHYSVQKIPSDADLRSFFAVYITLGGGVIVSSASIPLFMANWNKVTVPLEIVTVVRGSETCRFCVWTLYLSRRIPLPSFFLLRIRRPLDRIDHVLNEDHKENFW